MASQSTALGKRSTSSALMAPPPAPKRIKRPSVVLDEDTYTSAVSHIIRRDFFPGLAEADAQRDYLNAIESKDKSWIREAANKLTQVMTPHPRGKSTVAARTRLDRPGGAPERTPSVWGPDTPVAAVEAGAATSDGDEGLGKLDRRDLDLSLGAFQAKYISEDQESFSQIIDKQNQAKFNKTRWMHDGNMYASKQRMAQQRVLEAHAATTKSQDVAIVNRPSQDLDLRPAAPTFHKHTAFNSLMFNPDGVEQWAPTRAQRAEDASLAPPKAVLYNNTRLPAPEAEPTRPTSPTLSAIRDAVAGHPRLHASEAGYTGSETPRVNGYAFVDAQPPEPEPDPDSDSDSAPTNLLEKFGVDSNSKATPFTLPAASSREKLHLKMVDKISANRAQVANKKINPPTSSLGIFPSHTPRFPSAPTPARSRLHAAPLTPARKVKADLTPAAQRLLENVGGKTPGRVGAGRGFGVMGGGEWTPGSRVGRGA
ncbi:hypothetical protein LEMA_P099820.1 [Plenodomus lingam JN3]|uniref:Protein DGCR14 n=1 Tax=Leptosphaeria maculans (strain JN3 / isolate v23.1.3 / race Av1-4-5-6-7-8) TaxID=985895 RepID=E4ZZZ1_LEPMJ|nr:hypothetical protein LEMA_P099820.1 [Plenodomus lingam JN3]CBX96851.1 hypothetical protein LEMA_P099820.1 [Plenodomus lingam JN3]